MSTSRKLEVIPRRPEIDLTNKYAKNILAYFTYTGRTFRDLTKVYKPTRNLTGTGKPKRDGWLFNADRWVASPPNVGAEHTLILTFATKESAATYLHAISCRTAASGGDNYSLELNSGQLYFWQTSAGFNGYRITPTVNSGKDYTVVFVRRSGQAPKAFLNGRYPAQGIFSGAWSHGAPNTSTSFGIGCAAYSTGAAVSNTLIRQFIVLDKAVPDTVARYLSGNPFAMLKQSRGAPLTSSGVLTVLPSGIASAETFGSPTIIANQNLAPSSIASVEAFGTASIASNVTLSLTGISSAEAFGTASLIPGSVVIIPSSIVSAESFGGATVLPTNSILAVSIVSAEAFGSTALITGSVAILPSGVVSAEAFGTAFVDDGITIISNNNIIVGQLKGLLVDILVDVFD